MSIMLRNRLPPPEDTDWRGSLTIDSPGIGNTLGFTNDDYYPFYGELAEMYFWSDPLSSADVAWLWNGGAGQPQPSLTTIESEITDCTLLAAYRFANNANDFSGNGHNGTWTSGASYDSGIAAIRLAGKHES